MGSKQTIFVGERFKNKSGKWFEVIEYITGKKIRVRFDETGFETVAEGQQIRKGSIVDHHASYFKTGQKYEMSMNNILEIVEYKDSKNVVVKFLDSGYTTTVEACQIRRGSIKDLLKPSVSGVGYIGDGKFKPYDQNHKAEWSYLKWQNMLERCFTPSSEQMKETYKDVTVCDEWLNYQNFANWAVKQKGYGNYGWALEKDLIVKGNKHYDPDKCCFLPIELNNQMLKSTKVRGEYPIGVRKLPSKRFAAVLNNPTGTVYNKLIGVFDTPEEAFLVYKKAKESRLKFLAEKWKEHIDPRAYKALMSYQVEITD